MEKKIIEGTVKRHPDGFGFLIPDDRQFPDIYIPKHNMQGIMSNDRVAVQVHRSREQRNRYFGHIVKFIERQIKRVYGQYYSLSKQYGIILDHEGSWGSDIYIPIADSKNAHDGETVAVEILQEVTPSGHLMGRVIEIMGDLSDPMTDIQRVTINHQLPMEFPPAVEEQSKQFSLSVDAKDYPQRKNLTHMGFVTIDGVTAKDFDDAIYVETSQSGFHLWVAIADVSHYVKPKTAIDKEAYARGNSTYFPKYVIPMLPEVLSNELCSLKPQVDRLALVCEMSFNFSGEVLDSKIYEAVIRSRARLNYGVAQEIIDGHTPKEFKSVENTVLRARDLAKVLLAKRMKEGSLDLEIPETQIVLDDLGNPIDIIKAERLFSHRLIEELMLIANVCVAQFLSGKGADCLYRIHEPPLLEDMEVLGRFLHNWGGPHKLSGGKLQKKITRILESYAGKSQGEVLSMLILRSMRQARYSANNVGHFGLAFSHYTHFTSPIRRYPDLIVHRLVKHFVVNKKEYPLMKYDELEAAGTWLSACEQRSVKAERQLKAIKAARFMQQFLGQEFDGVISSINKMGLFVLLRQYDISGLIRMDSLDIRDLEYDEESLSLYSAKKGICLKVGDTLRVQVALTNIEEGKVDFVLAQKLKAQENLHLPKATKAGPFPQKRLGQMASKKRSLKKARRQSHRHRSK